MYVYRAHIHYVCPRRDVYGEVPRAADDGAERGGMKMVWRVEWYKTTPFACRSESIYNAYERCGEYTTHTTHDIINMDVESRN